MLRAASVVFPTFVALWWVGGEIDRRVQSVAAINVHSDHQPVANATMYLVDGAGAVTTAAVSDSMGRLRFAIDPERRREYRAIICAPGYFPVVPRSLGNRFGTHGYGMARRRPGDPLGSFSIRRWRFALPETC
jgi:hypothetical protein